MSRDESLVDTIKKVKTSSVVKVITRLWRIFVWLTALLLIVILVSESWRAWTSSEILSTLFGLIACSLELKSSSISQFCLRLFR